MYFNGAKKPSVSCLLGIDVDCGSGIQINLLYIEDKDTVMGLCA